MALAPTRATRVSRSSLIDALSPDMHGVVGAKTLLMRWPLLCSPKASLTCRAKHDLCTRNHTRKRLRDLVTDVVEHLRVNGPWCYKLSDIYADPAVTAAVESVTMEQTLVAADRVYQSHVDRFRQSGVVKHARGSCEPVHHACSSIVRPATCVLRLLSYTDFCIMGYG
jgi:hypothetical protein